MITGFQNIGKIPELRKRILFTVAMLVVYRIGCHIPIPGIDPAALKIFFASMKNTLFGFFDLFAGGAFNNMSIMALGIMPYISSSIILELLTVVVPLLERLKKEGEQGRKKIVQYTRYGTILLSAIQGFGIAVWLERSSGANGLMIVPNGGWAFKIITVITLTAGTAFLMWLGEQITERGIGNGISLIIFAGIVARFMPEVVNTFRLLSTGEIGIFVMIILLGLMIAIVGFIIFMERGQRRIPVQYAKRVVGRKMYGGASTHMPLKINTAGVIPPIFASSILVFPATIATFVDVKKWPIFTNIMNYFSPGHLVYIVLYVILIIFFCYFYTAVHFNPVDVADNMKKYGGFVPGIRPGKNTADYIDRVLTRITFWGSLYIALVCVLPTIISRLFHVPFYYGGTSLLIVIGVAMDTLAQIESHMLTRHYEGFMKKGLIKGRS
jgi:preprotein translocase subunit SecY